MRKATLDLEGGKLILAFPYSPTYVKQMHGIRGSEFDYSRKAWVIPNSQLAIDAIKRIFPALEIGPGLKTTASGESDNLITAEERKYLPKSKDVEITDFQFKTTPYWHQKVTFNFARALPQSGIFLEQGCISGDAIISYSRAGASHKTKLKDFLKCGFVGTHCDFKKMFQFMFVRLRGIYSDASYVLVSHIRAKKRPIH